MSANSTILPMVAKAYRETEIRRAEARRLARLAREGSPREPSRPRRRAWRVSLRGRPAI